MSENVAVAAMLEAVTCAMGDGDPVGPDMALMAAATAMMVSVNAVITPAMLARTLAAAGFSAQKTAPAVRHQFADISALDLARALQGAYPTLDAPTLRASLEACSYATADVDAAVQTLFPQNLALYLDGAAAVEIGAVAKLDITGAITIMAWIRPEAFDGIRNIMARGFHQNPNSEVYFRIIENKYQIGSWDGADHWVEAPIPAEDHGNWVHLAGVSDGTTWSLYRNGVCVASRAMPPGAIQSSGWSIGARWPACERYFKGFIRHVGVWRTALTAEQIRRAMTAIDPAGAGLAACWPLDESQGSVARDRAADPANGTIVGGQWLTPPAWPSTNAGLQARWTFSADARDSSGHGRDATLVGAEIVANARGTEGAAQMAPSQYIGTPRIEVGATDFTFATWVRVASTATRNILYADWMRPWQFMWAINTNGAVALNLRKNINSGGSDPNQDLVALLSPEGKVQADARWHHVAVTWQRDNRRATAYVNGEVVMAEGTRPADYPDLTLQQNEHPSYFIGRKEDTDDTTSWFGGHISDFRVYDRALSAAEIMLLAQG